ncbi:hypothetical protein L3V77_19430 [Vibrio sp. DW001]|uniref:hypothetical protein n=1 Tax=Vibrio sp. DW001 TaxID=2912315 RepID=UPI0023B19B38|nr:hypothetical protein [Vibrio sp. DW001]WED29590.1 hypothetical protein L3V77_19430 [Vibrio sp. DW001]
MTQIDQHQHVENQQAINSDDGKEAMTAIALYENHLKDGCQQLLTLNQILLKAERGQRRRQTLNRLSWICGLSVLVIIISYLTVGVNLITAIGLLVAYFSGLILHDKLSPAMIVPEETNQLYTLNNQLREEISSAEENTNGLLFRLLRQTNLLETARSRGLLLEDNKVDLYQLEANGLYQYLDAINLLMEHKDRLKGL